jgi:hypothetical protein
MKNYLKMFVLMLLMFCVSKANAGYWSVGYGGGTTSFNYYNNPYDYRYGTLNHTSNYDWGRFLSTPTNSNLPAASSAGGSITVSFHWVRTGIWDIYPPSTITIRQIVVLQAYGDKEYCSYYTDIADPDVFVDSSDEFGYYIYAMKDTTISTPGNDFNIAWCAPGCSAYSPQTGVITNISYSASVVN